MKLAGTKRLRKVRNTIYQDPGNPFAVDDPSLSQDQVSSSYGDYGSKYNGADHWKSQPGYRWQDTRLDVDDKHSEPSEPWDLASTRDADTDSESSRSSPQSVAFVFAPTPQHATSMEPRHGDRRSMSVEISFLPSWIDQIADTDNVCELPPRGWRSDSLPTLHIQPAGEIALRDGRRDTDFYAFYDDLLAEYGIGMSYR